MTKLKSNEEIDAVIAKIREELRDSDIAAVESIQKLLESHTDLHDSLMQRDAALQKAIKLYIEGSAGISDFKVLGRSLIIATQESEIKLLREAIEQQDGNGVKLVKDTIEFPERDSEGNLAPAAHFKGELIWAKVEQDGILVYRIAPDTLLGISFSQTPLMFLEHEASLMAFDSENSEGMFRFVSDRLGQDFPKGKQVEKFGLLKDMWKEVKFVDKHDAKIAKIRELIEGMKTVRGYELLGINIYETWSKTIKPTAKHGEKGELVLYTNVTGVFHKPGEEDKTGKGEILGTIEQAEWVFFEHAKSATKFDVKSVASGNAIQAPQKELNELIYTLGELVKEGREILLNRAKENGAL